MNLTIAGAAQTRQVTRGSGEYFGVDWVGAGTVFYASDSSGAWDIWELDLGSGRASPLTHDAALDFFPAVSPDGAYVAFVSNRAGQRNVWELDRAKRSLRRVTSGQGEQWPRYSPDGSQIIYTSYGKGFWDARVVDRATGRDRELTSRRAITGEFSPDGQSIAVIAEDQTRIEIVDRGGRATKTLDVPAGFSMTGNLRWRRDGAALFYVVSEGGAANIWEQRIDDGSRRKVTDFASGNIEQFDTEPDGDRLIVIHGVVFNDAVLLSLEGE